MKQKHCKTSKFSRLRHDFLRSFWKAKMFTLKENSKRHWDERMRVKRQTKDLKDLTDEELQKLVEG